MQNTDDVQMKSGDDLAAQALDQANSSFVSPTDVSSVTGDQVGETLVALQNVIERNAIELDRINEELKLLRDSLKSIFENDTTLSEVEEKASQVVQQVKERKAQLQSTLEVNQLKSQIADASSRMKEVKEALNNHLVNLFKLTGIQTFDTSTGDQREFEVRASLKGKKATA